MQITGSVTAEDDGAPLAGIAVSDGRSWAVTGADGSFSLECAAGRPVWARRPAAWPGGRWWAHAVPGEPATLRLRAAAAAPVPGETLLAHVSDPHVSAMSRDPRQAAELATRFGDGTDTAAALQGALADAADRGAALALITGDLTDHGTEAEFRRFAEIVAAAPLPVEVVPGNHDHYGHRHDPAPDDAPRGSGFLGGATTSRYEQVIGPRWWSADLAGLHVVALDWYSAWCGIDTVGQRQFVTDDLASRDPALPVLVLAHDVPDDDALGLLRERAGSAGLLAVLTGHWHATRQLIMGGCHLIGTAALGFGGLDWSPPQWRLITVSRPGASVRLLHQTVPTATSPAPGGRRGACAGDSLSLGVTQHLGILAADRGAVLAPSVSEDGVGLVSRVHPADGLRWTARAARDPVTGIRAADGQVLAASSAGQLAALDTETGQPRWAYQLPGRHRRRVLAAPLVTPAGEVIIGDVGAVACLDLATGYPRWELAGPGTPDTLLTYGTGLIAGELAVMPFGGPGAGLTALRLADGSLAWTDPPGTPPPSSSLTPAGDGEALVLRTATPSLERFELGTGRLRWRVTLQGRFSTAAALVTGDDIVLVTGDGNVHHLDPDTGEYRAPYRLHGLRESYGPYRSTGTGAPTAPVMTGHGPVITLLDGSVWQLGPAGAHLAGDAGEPVTTQPTAASPDILAVITTGAALRFVDLGATVTAAGPSGQVS